MTKEEWIAELECAYKTYSGKFLSDKDCKELFDLLTSKPPIKNKR